MRLQRSIARVNPSTKDSGNSVLSDMDGMTGMYSTIACAAIYIPGGTTESMKEGGTPSRGPRHRERSVCTTSVITRVITYDGLSSKHDRERGTCVSQEGPLLSRRKFITLDMQTFPELSQGDTKPKRSYEVEGRDVDTEPGERCYWFQCISVYGHD
jgi:hypothetical protein